MDGVGPVLCEGPPGWGYFCLRSGDKTDLVSLKDGAKSSSVFCGVYGFGMALGSPPANVQGCVPVLLKNQHGASATGTWRGLTY